MSKPDLQLVRQALREHFERSLSGLLDLKLVSWQNRGFKPPPVDPPQVWVRETFQPIGEPSQFLFDSLHVATGRIVFDTFYPKGKGTEPVDGIVKAITDAFGEKHSLNTQGVVVAIDRVERSPGRQADEAWWMGSVSIYWRTYSPASTGV